MSPKTAVFTHNDGRSVNLLQSEGTIPMVYQNVTYNIPVVIWLMETYPLLVVCQVAGRVWQNGVVCGSSACLEVVIILMDC
ncbi:Steadiness box [Artemisia annua]|uniref:Steadiness box n=1 Tax=Artemisia annua TaxID=35608 RepID=A0A2U1LP95_ARTAN|nr:Steadiness box [Artemisia annua]